MKPNASRNPRVLTQSVVASQIRAFGPLYSVVLSAQTAVSDRMSHEELLRHLEALIAPEDHKRVMMDIEHENNFALAVACEKVLEAAFGDSSGCSIGESQVLLAPNKRQEIEWMHKEITAQVRYNATRIQFATKRVF
jgi:myosin heavy subunit